MSLKYFEKEWAEVLPVHEFRTWFQWKPRVHSKRLEGSFHRVNLFKPSYPVEWLDLCMESVNLFRPCLPASSAVPIRIRPLWSIGSVENPSSAVPLSAESSQIVANHRFSLPSGQSIHHLLQRSLDTLFFKKVKFLQNSRCGVFSPTLWGETCQCRAENYQGLDLGPWRVNWNRFAPEKTVRTWRKTNASRSTIRRKWICPRQLREIRWFFKGGIKNRTSENQTKITSFCEIHGKSMDIRFIITRVVNFSPKKCRPEGLHGCNEAMDRETYHRDVGLWGWHRGGAWMPRWGSAFLMGILNENGSS